MAFTGNASNATIFSDTAFAVPNNYSWAFWYKARRVVGSSQSNCAFSFCSSGSSPGVEIDFHWSHTNSIFQKAWSHKQATGGAIIKAVLATTPTAETWYHIAGTYDSTNMRLYLNGALETTIAATVSAVTSSKVALGSFFQTVNWDDATIAEFGLWNAQLSAGEVGGLYAGVCPLMTRPTAILTYANCRADATEVTGHPMSLFGTTNFTSNAHPKIFYPRRAYIQATADGKTFHQSCSGGVAMAGTSTATAGYVEACSGGATVSGSSEVGMEFSLSHSMTITDYDPTLRQYLDIDQELTQMDYHNQFSQGLSVRQRLRAITNYLAAGRYRE